MKLGVLISFSGMGGVERMVLNLVNQFAEDPSLQVELLVIRADGPHLNHVADGVLVKRLKARHTLTAIPELVRYLRKTQPDGLLVAKDRAGRAAIVARALARSNTPVAIRLGTNLSTALAGKAKWQAWLRTAPMKSIYRHAHRVVAVSEGVRQDTIAITQLPAEKVQVIRNPVITQQFYDQAKQPVDHLWLRDKSLPVVMAAGRLTKQKGFDTLIQAFAQLLKTKPARLLILGEGNDRASLEALCETLDITNNVAMPGFQTNLYAWLKQADLFVLSSRWEGSPNVLTEALALGIPSVATRCPSGPDEVLQQGEVGHLVPVDDIHALSDAMLATLAAPPSAERLTAAVADYNASTSAQRYLSIFR